MPFYINKEGTKYDEKRIIGGIGYLVCEDFDGKIIRTEENIRKIYARKIKDSYSCIDEFLNNKSKKKITKKELVEDFYEKLSKTKSLFEAGDKNYHHDFYLKSKNLSYSKIPSYPLIQSRHIFERNYGFFLANQEEIHKRIND